MASHLRFEFRPRFVTAASLFDGHDASINIIRRVLQAAGAEVIHLGHDRSVAEVVRSAVQEDARGLAVSSYQGGHNEYFTYLLDLLRGQNRGDLKVFGGGGGTITDAEIAALEEAGVARIYSAETGRRIGLEGMAAEMMSLVRGQGEVAGEPSEIHAGLTESAVARWLTWAEAVVEAAMDGDASAVAWRERLEASAAQARLRTVVVGITGTGGAGKSSLTDELVRRFLTSYPELRIGVISVDPTRKRTGGALLGDRIRMNAVFDDRVFMRSLATRQADRALSEASEDCARILALAGYDLILLETAGIGQSDSKVTELCDVSLYVMTPEFGAPSQLEKIEMLDYADLVAINKADKRGSEDARKYVAKQMQRNRVQFDRDPDAMPVFTCSASRFGDAGVNRLFGALTQRISDVRAGWVPASVNDAVPSLPTVVPSSRTRYLSEIGDTVRGYHQRGSEQAGKLRSADGLSRSLAVLGAAAPGPLDRAEPTGDAVQSALAAKFNEVMEKVPVPSRALVASAAKDIAAVTAEENVYAVRGREIRLPNYRKTLSDSAVPKVAAPQTTDWAELLRWRMKENLPGQFPFTAGVFPYKREGEDPTRMFAGEGGPERTNRRFHYVSKGQLAARLSTAFDSVTLYGRDPDRRLDIWGKVGNSGVSVATVDDAKRLYSGFDLGAPTTSVSMTINGPAPIILAMYCNAAIDQAVEKRLAATGRLEEVVARLDREGRRAPYRAAELPEGHNGLGLALLGVSGDEVLSAEEYAEVKSATLRQIRGTVQADILKEDQAQNTCIFSTDFSLKLMGDIQAYFVEKQVQNFYSVSISGYHIAEAGANPITQLAFTLANGFTFVEYYLSRGMKIDDFARNLSFFFSNGLDAEYAVIGRVARRIWAIAMREKYGANERSQQLKYHIQTSGRSLHAQEIDFNDIRTTLQAFYALADNCNSLHTNAYDEAITTPTEESVRRALAIQLISNRELGLLFNENPLQGSYLIEQLTRIVEDAVLEEFDRLTERGGVLGAMELMYQRAKIQEESMHYEHKKFSGELPIIGVNTFLSPNPPEGVVEIEVARATDAEKLEQIEGLEAFKRARADRSGPALAELKRVAIAGENVFETLLETVKHCSLGQVTEALFSVGGQYRRGM